MTFPLWGPDRRYRVTVVALSSEDGHTFSKHRAGEGTPLADLAVSKAGQKQKEAPEGLPDSFRVLVADRCSVLLALGENGLTVRSLTLLGATQAVITAEVEAGPGAPDWLPTESTYLLFEGNQKAVRDWKERYIPLEGMAKERSWPQEYTPLDMLAVAVGRSLTRANAALARTGGKTGGAMVAAVTFRVAVERTDLGHGRVLVTLANGGQPKGEQFVEFTLNAVPPAVTDNEQADTTGPGPNGPRE